MSHNSPNMTDSENSKCHAIIHSAATAAGAVGAGLAQLPFADYFIITPIQIAMVGSLGSVFDKSLEESAIKSLISAASATIVGRSVSQILLGWLPGIGNGINASTAFTITEAIGWAIANNFANEKREAEAEATKKAERVRREAEATQEAERREREAEATQEAEPITTKIIAVLMKLLHAVWNVIKVVWNITKSLFVFLGNVTQFLGSTAIIAGIIVFILDKFNLLPTEYQPYLTIIREFLEVIR